VKVKVTAKTIVELALIEVRTLLSPRFFLEIPVGKIPVFLGTSAKF
jgi:hypothetical protein